ncbi:hypothetical protein BD779DRAFT_1668265 [Infundibulicybe gibba]|nr:hypothetical protein BD779DRAFT_1668265 [Infundibulicybe gibba]
MTTAIDAQNAVTLLSSYDIILDCTDNAPTRYLLSDTAVRLGKPLVSAAAQKFEGQLCTYNLGPNGPCYRCIFPKPPAPETVGTCAETGILGVVTGIMGNLQALEALKILTGLREEGPPSMLIFSALGMPPFRSVKLRSRNPACAACGAGSASVEETDYVQFCGGPTPDWERRGLAVGDFRASVKEFSAIISSGRAIHILDVRPATEYGICRFSLSQNVPLKLLVANPREYIPPDPSAETYVICRLGNDSQTAADALRSVAPVGAGGLIKDVVGGLKAWSKDVDPSFPVY